MFHGIAANLSEMFVEKGIVSDEDIEIYIFGFECLIANIVQFLFLNIIGLLFNCFFEIIAYTLGFITIKRHIGGWHANSHFQCLLAFSIIAISSVFACKYISVVNSIGLLGVSMVLILLLAPIEHFNNPKTEYEKKQGRTKALIIGFVEFVCILFLLISPISHYGTFAAAGLFMAALSLIFPITEKGGTADVEN